jgi:hypothetical protein
VVFAATAPKKAAADGWNWPWVRNALIAHNHLFHLVYQLEEQGSERDVRLSERELDAKTLGLVLQCRSAETCKQLVRVLRHVVPRSAAKLVCAGPGNEAEARGTPFGFTLEALHPSVPGYAGEACARLAACAAEQGARLPETTALECQAKPTHYPLECARHLTCFDVAGCARYPQGAFRFSPFVHWGEQVDARGEVFSGGVGDVGGGGLSARDVNQWIPVMDSGYGWRGAWATLITDLQVHAGSGQLDSSGQARWSVAAITPTGQVHLGPRQSTDATEFSTTNLPAAMGVAGAAKLFDYDGDSIPELLLPVVTSAHANSGSRKLQVWHFARGKVARYPGTESLPVVFATDADADGRPDLVLDPVDAFDDQNYTHSSYSSAEWKLAHSLKDGSFSQTDVVATGYRGEGE